MPPTPFTEVFIAISLILGDGLYNLVKIIAVTTKEWCKINTTQAHLPVVTEMLDEESYKLLQEQKQLDEVFLKDSIPNWFAASGYLGLAAISTDNSYDATHLSTLQVISGPLLIYNFPCPCFLQLIWFWAHRLELGLYLREDWPIYGCIIGRNGRRVIAGLAACGAMTTIVSTAADLMQDFKTGYLTLTSAKSMFVSQLEQPWVVSLHPGTFWLNWTAFEIGSPDSLYKAPYAVILREVAILGVEGFSELPKHCLAICCGFFVGALVINLCLQHQESGKHIKSLAEQGQ